MPAGMQNVEGQLPGPARDHAGLDTLPTWRGRARGPAICRSSAKTDRPTDQARENAVVLVDTSVWIDVLRKPARLRLEDHMDFD